MGVSQELIKGTVVPVVLALLKDRPRYGYEMVQLVNARTNGALDWSEGTLYPVLHRLEADGLVSAEWRERPPKSDAADASAAKGGTRRRRYYTLTRAGRRELDRRATEWRAFTAAVGEFLGRMMSMNDERLAPSPVYAWEKRSELATARERIGERVFIDG